jgi:UDP-N-acetylmuramyl pentapeptide phosphotransferase/UDP-N-acetylglucosamine-1-phosphate transferase
LLEILFAFGVSLFISVASIPHIITVSRLKKLYDVPDERKSHRSAIPTLGGLAIFAGFTISASLFYPKDATLVEFKYIIPAVLIVFFIGIKDDILITSAIKKLLGQIIAALIIVIMGKIRITSMYGLFGLETLNESWSLALSTFTILVIMNGINLIDGINCLAGGVAMVVSSFFGVWFCVNGFQGPAIIAVTLLGGVLGFLYFNRTPARIFMGDTGSLIIGLILAVLAIKFIELNKVASSFSYKSAPIVAFGVLIVPLFDTLRVMLYRILKGHSPLNPDQNHVHHRLLEIGLTHMQASSVIMVVNILFIVVVSFYRLLDNLMLLAIVLILASVISYIPSIILRRIHSRK